ncbi:MAG: Hpt domain-containing protein [Pararhodobacter sp.]|nr:Hpt domain-containing protein [Pararhodobacter sp.]
MIDWSQIEELRTEMDDAFDEVVALFLEETDEIMDRVRAARAVPYADGLALASDLHALKGAALNLGLTEFAASCGAGEELAQSGAAGAVNLQGIIDTYTVSKTEFLAVLSRHAA